MLWQSLFLSNWTNSGQRKLRSYGPQLRLQRLQQTLLMLKETKLLAAKDAANVEAAKILAAKEATDADVKKLRVVKEVT